MFSSYYPSSILCIIYAKAQLLLAWKIEKGPDSQNYSVYRGQLYELKRSCPTFLPMAGRNAFLQGPAVRFHLPGDTAKPRQMIPWSALISPYAGSLMYGTEQEERLRTSVVNKTCLSKDIEGLVLC